MTRVFHILPEGESFSEFSGGAISRWAANILHGDPDAVIVATSADETWLFPLDRIRLEPRFRFYNAVKMSWRGRLPWVPLRSLLRLMLGPVLSRLQPDDVVWVHNRPEIAATIRRSVESVGARLVLHMHNSHLLTARPDVLSALSGVKTVFVSQFLKREACGRCKDFERGTVLHNGADKQIFYPRQKPPPESKSMTILFAGRLVPEKGPHVFASALRILHDKGVRVQGVIVGSAGFGNKPATPFVDELVRSAPPNLTFRPYCSGVELGQVFREADVFCVPSTWDDPFPLAPIEAMATGLPVVASRSGGIPEALIAGGGILLDSISPSSLAIELERVATDSTLRSRLAKDAYESFLSHFCWSELRIEYRKILKSIKYV